MYKILVAEDAADFIRAQTKKIQRQLYNKIKNLRSNPYPPNCVKLKGREDLYRIRSGVIILVLRIAHRKQVYKELP
jgi:mRNA-degrading endonuclease RelE of RelBE toxin-antitoxin system